jgi:hypothetical protein
MSETTQNPNESGENTPKPEEKAKGKTPSKTTKVAVVGEGSVSHLILLENDTRKVHIADKGNWKQVSVTELNIASDEDTIAIRAVDFQVPKGEKPMRVLIKVSTKTFEVMVMDGLIQRNPGGTIPFSFSENSQEARMEMFLALKACTEHTKEGEDLIFSSKAKKLVGERFELARESEIVQKCMELNRLNFGNLQADVQDVLYFPGYSSDLKLPKECMPKFDLSVKSFAKLPD